MRLISIIDNPQDHPPETTGTDKAYTAAKAAISQIPIVGGTLSEFVDLVLAPPIEARRNAWLESLVQRLRALEDKRPGFRIEELKNDPSFVSTMIQATQAAMRTHQKTKIDALRNAVLNAASGTAPPDDLSELFLIFVDSFTPQHLLVLELLVNQRKGSLDELPWLAAELGQQVAADLEARGLIRGNRQRPTVEMRRSNYGPSADFREHPIEYFFGTQVGIFQPAARVTELGKQFFTFITQEHDD